MDPFVKWAGGKRQLLPILRSYLPETYNRYFEPFVGGGALLFDLRPNVAIINDVNEELINCYSVIRDNLDDLIESLELHQIMHDNDYYYLMRRAVPLSRVDQAARLIYLNKTCFNGLYRVNSKDQFNVPVGRYKNPTICDRTNLTEIHKYLNTNKIELLCGSFEAATMSAARNDFVYFDPPYDRVKDDSFTKYSKKDFTKDDQVILALVFRDLTRRGVMVMLSNSSTDFIRDLYRDYTQITVQAKRNVNSDAAKRGVVNELLICNFM